MATDFVEKDNLVFPGGEPALSTESRAELANSAFIIVTQAFCPNGHDLVAIEGPTFDGFPGITIKVRGQGEDGLITLSPMHGDGRKESTAEFADGQRYDLVCPVCDVALPKFARCDCGEGRLHAIDLVPSGKGEIVAICDVAGCRRSRVADGLEVLAVFVQPGDPDYSSHDDE
jgi:hypothetical protein